MMHLAERLKRSIHGIKMHRGGCAHHEQHGLQQHAKQAPRACLPASILSCPYAPRYTHPSSRSAATHSNCSQ